MEKLPADKELLDEMVPLSTVIKANLQLHMVHFKGQCWQVRWKAGKKEDELSGFAKNICHSQITETMDTGPMDTVGLLY